MYPDGVLVLLPRREQGGRSGVYRFLTQAPRGVHASGAARGGRDGRARSALSKNPGRSDAPPSWCSLTASAGAAVSSWCLGREGERPPGPSGLGLEVIPARSHPGRRGLAEHPLGSPSGLGGPDDSGVPIASRSGAVRKRVCVVRQAVRSKGEPLEGGAVEAGCRKWSRRDVGGRGAEVSVALAGQSLLPQRGGRHRSTAALPCGMMALVQAGVPACSAPADGFAKASSWRCDREPWGRGPRHERSSRRRAGSRRR